MVSEEKANTKCFEDPLCEEVRRRLAAFVDEEESKITCDTKLIDLGFGSTTLPGLAPMINSLREREGKERIPISKVTKSKTVGDLCALLK
jgi:hypothetical protein